MKRGVKTMDEIEMDKFARDLRLIVFCFSALALITTVAVIYYVWRAM